MVKGKLTKSVSLSPDVCADIEQNLLIKSFSDWVEEKYKEEFMGLEIEKIRLKHLEDEIKKTREKIVLLESIEKESVVSDDAYHWLKTTGLARLKKFHINGILSWFNTNYKYNLTMQQFRKLIDRAKEDAKIKNNL